MTLGHTTVLVGNSGSVFREGLNKGYHEKAPVCCPCCRLSTLHCAPWTLMLFAHTMCYLELKSGFPCCCCSWLMAPVDRCRNFAHNDDFHRKVFVVAR